MAVALIAGLPNTHAILSVDKLCDKTPLIASAKADLMLVRAVHCHISGIEPILHRELKKLIYARLMKAQDLAESSITPSDATAKHQNVCLSILFQQIS